MGKLYLLPKTQKKLLNVPGRPVISNRERLLRISLIFWTIISNLLCRRGYITSETLDIFKEKIKTIGIVSENAIFFAADVVDLCPDILHQIGLKAPKEAHEKTNIKKIPTEDLMKMEKIVLNNNMFEFNSNVYQQKSVTAIGSKHAPPYA